MNKLNNQKYDFSLDKDPYNFTMSVFCNRWKPFIIQAINFDKSTRYSKFKKFLPISEKVLADNLKELERDGIIVKNIYKEIPLRVEYTLTDIGKSICPILDIMYSWGREEMIRRNMEIDQVGEMWHGYIPIDKDILE